MIVYYSGTGNSRYCAEYFAKKLDDEVLDAAHYIKHQIAADLVSGKPWIFVAPTYAWQLPLVFRDFIRSGSFMGSSDAWFVMTCGGDIGNAGAYIRPLCEERGLKYRGVLEVVMPENYIAMFDVPNREEANQIITAARPVLEQGAELILRGESFPETAVSMKDKAKSGKIHDVFYKKFVHDKDFYATDSCISCGKCVNHCVLNNIRLENGRPVWGGTCTHCMACICGCPAEAIEYGKKSQGKPRYFCPPFRAENCCSANRFGNGLQLVIVGLPVMIRRGLRQIIGALQFYKLPEGVCPQPQHGTPNIFVLQFDLHIVAVDQKPHPVNDRSITVQASQNIPGHVGTDSGVSIGMSHTVLIQMKAPRLADIMKQGCQPQNRIQRRVEHTLNRVLPDIIAVMLVVLVKACQRLQFRDEMQNCITINVLFT